MGISNRDYYHAPSSVGEWGSPGLTPAVKAIVVVTSVVFILQLLIVRDERLSMLDELRRYDPELNRIVTEAEQNPEARKALEKKHPEIARLMEADSNDPLIHPHKVSILQEWLQLDTKKVVQNGQGWRLLTCAFCHDRLGIFHIVINMFILIWFGCTVERMYGSKEFFIFYLAAALAASLAFVALDLYTGSTIPAVGASGAVFGVVMLYILHFPHETICFMWTQVELRWVLLIYIIWDLHPVVLALAGDRAVSGIAHAAHLGGLAFGYVYSKSSWRLESIIRLPGLRTSSKSGTQFSGSARVRSEDSERVDSLLAKISQSGADSLTDAEREYLRRVSQRRRRGGGL
jgi:membrane associated rhomboid family serine protease